MEKYEKLFGRSIGTLIIDQGVIIRARPVNDDRTEIELAPDIDAGAIVRDPETGRLYYDVQMREILGIVETPDFETDLEAGNRLNEFLPPLSQVNAKARQIAAERRQRSPGGW